MSLRHILLKLSFGLGSVSLVGLAALGTLQARSALAAASTASQISEVRPQGSLLSQGQGQNQAPGDCQGQGRRGAPLATAAAQLGVSEAALRSALGMPERHQRPDLAAAAAQLGTTEDELRTSLRNQMQAHRQAHQGQGPHAGPPDFTALAQQYGVSEAEFRRIMGIPNRPDMATAAAQLGVSEEALQEALRSAHGGRGPGGNPGRTGSGR